MASLTDKPAGTTETRQTAGESKPPTERARHPLLSLRDEIDRLFEDFSLMAMRTPFRTRLFDFEPLRRFESAFSGAVPTAEVAEKDNEYVVTVELPGIDQKNVDINITGNLLTNDSDLDGHPLTITSAACASSSSTSQVEAASSCLSTPAPMVALPCASRSTSSTRFGVAASAAARLTAVVVLPTPPFWLATAMMRAMSGGVPRCDGWSGARRGPDPGLCTAPPGATDHHQVAFRVEARNRERAHLAQFPAGRQRGDLVGGHDALHRQQASTGHEQVAAFQRVSR